MPYVAPGFKVSAFNCPNPACGAYSRQNWKETFVPSGTGGLTPIVGLYVSYCDHCGNYSVWLNKGLLFPISRTAPPPHADMPEDIRADYEEARSIYESSPRSSAALLRLAIQKLCIELGQPGKNLNADIGELVKLGLPVLVQQSLDIVRVVGNNQVHPGTLDVRDDPEMAMRLFELVNIIVEDRIARPKQIQAMYAKLPDTARKQIQDRDGKP